MGIDYRISTQVSVNEFIDLLKRSTLGERRPIDDLECMSGMIKNSNLMVTAWDKEKLIGIARSMTDFHYACYLSDLAVDKAYQKQGIGKSLQKMTQQQLGPRCKLILISAPAAMGYYKQLGFEYNERCWVLPKNRAISD